MLRADFLQGDSMPGFDRGAAIRYATGAMRQIQGWVHDGAATTLIRLAELQDEQGIAGDVGEIGIHHGKYFILLAHLLRPGEAGLAIDLFGRQQANIDESGRGDRGIFERHLADILGRDTRVIIREADSLTLRDGDLACDGRQSFRLFSIDGGHTAIHLANDLALVERVLHEHGIVIVDDFYNPAWPGVNEGMHCYWFGGGRLRPFAYGGGKLYLCRPAGWEMYYRSVVEMIPLAVSQKRVTLANTPCLMLEMPAPGGVFAEAAAQPSPDDYGVHTAIVSRRPNIVAFPMDHGATGYQRFADGSTSVTRLAAAVGEGGHLLVTPWWSLADTKAWTSRLAELRRDLAASPGVGLRFLCNDEAEIAAAEAAGFPAALVNQNAFLDETIFDVTGAERIFDAVYNARMVPFKRHELASGIESLALVYYHYKDLDRRFEAVRRILKQAEFLNGDPLAGTYQHFDRHAVAASLNRARVGLCLSAIEGAMYASVEYLLCGLCIVSTPSLGGRDQFFDERFCLEAEPNPDAVADSVRQLVQRQVPPALIRDATLARVVRHRRRYVDLVDTLRHEAGQQGQGDAAVGARLALPWNGWTPMTLGQIRDHFASPAAA
jgi:SAM-dependent methyltransferase